MKPDVVSDGRAIYSDPSVVERYRGTSGLQPVEALILSRIGHEFVDKRILDLGVGAGRTTPYLLEISKNYIGIDFSPTMIAACRAHYPTVSFAVGDARDLSQFSMASFDFILFSYNGIDTLDHAGRLQALAEARRILVPGGVFIFSSRTPNYRIRKPWDIYRLRQLPNALTNPTLLFKTLKNYAAGIYHYLKLRSREEHTEEYIIRSTDTFNYSQLFYSITIEAQLAQLRRVGFHEVEVLSYNDPRVLRPDEYAGCNDPWIYYVCRANANQTP